RLRGLDLDSGLLERLPDGAEGLRRGRDLEARPVLSDVVRPTLGRGERDAVLVRSIGVDGDNPAPLEQPGDGARRAQAAFVLREYVADVGSRLVAVVRQRFDEIGRASCRERV